MTITLILTAVILLIGLSYIVLIGTFKKVSPKIINIEGPIRMIGVSMRTTQRTIMKDAVTLGKEYLKIKKQDLIQNKVTPWRFVAISKDFEGSESWEYLMGDVVTSLNTIPNGLKFFEIPAKEYAVFTIRPKSKFAWGISIGRMKKYIYADWIEKSDYDLDNSVIGDFELHDERSESKNPEIDLYVSVRKKK